MTRNKNKQIKKRENPLYNVRKRVPRPMANFDGSTLHGTHFATRDLTAAFIASHNLVVDCGNSFVAVGGVKIAESIGRDLTGITSKYQEYRYTSVTVRWIPHVGPGNLDAGASIYMAYVDNPEVMWNAKAGASANDLVYAKSLRNLQTYNAWEGFTYKVPLTSRNKWFNVDLTPTYASPEAYARSVQGIVIAGMESLSAIVDLGVFHTTYDVELRGLSTSITT